jgi:hypothetical protein
MKKLRTVQKSGAKEIGVYPASSGDKKLDNPL